MSLLTSTRTGQPARTRKVGWRLRSRPVICWPTCCAELATPLAAEEFGKLHVSAELRAIEVCAGHRADVDGPPIGHDDPVPGDEGAVLAVGDLAVVLTDQARALRDQHGASGSVVIDRFGDLGDHLARQVGVDRRDQGGRDDAPGLHLPRAQRRLQRIGQIIVGPGTGGELALGGLAVGRLHLGGGRLGRGACRRGDRTSERGGVRSR